MEIIFVPGNVIYDFYLRISIGFARPQNLITHLKMKKLFWVVLSYFIYAASHFFLQSSLLLRGRY